MKTEGDNFVFDSGKEINVSYGIVGINSKLNISEGFDAEMYSDELTPEEKADLADYMIDLWNKFKVSI